MVMRSGKSYEYNVECPICGFKKKNYEMKRRWDGLMVCKDDWEMRHPMDFYRAKNDAHKLPYTLPAQENNLTATNTATNVNPSSAPSATGLYWFNTLTGVTYKSVGTATVNDWVRIQ